MADRSPFVARDARIKPWTNDLSESDFVYNCDKIGADTIEAARLRLEKYGLCVVRRAGITIATAPSLSGDPTEGGSIDPSIGAFLEMFGMVSTEQSDARGAASKLIVTSPTADELAGNHPGTLLAHADGTHLVEQPIIIILQYLVTPDVGGALRFIDMAGVMDALFSEDASKAQDMVNCLAMEKSVCIVKPMPDGSEVRNESSLFFNTSYSTTRVLGCRGRFDDKVVPSPAVKQEFERVRALVTSGDFQIPFLPKPGDIVLLDNWRVLHGRGLYQTVSTRAHRRAWISRLSHTMQEKTLLGLRPLSVTEKKT